MMIDVYDIPSMLKGDGFPELVAQDANPTSSLNIDAKLTNPLYPASKLSL